jgi:hypothetical protein
MVLDFKTFSEVAQDFFALSSHPSWWRAQCNTRFLALSLWCTPSRQFKLWSNYRLLIHHKLHGESPQKKSYLHWSHQRSKSWHVQKEPTLYCTAQQRKMGSSIALWSPYGNSLNTTFTRMLENPPLARRDWHPSYRKTAHWRANNMHINQPSQPAVIRKWN